jgi:hypothetical protein
MIQKLIQAHKYVDYAPQDFACAPALPGDFYTDGCIDRTDLSVLMDQIRAHSHNLAYDLNGDGKVDVADARFLVLHFTNPGGLPCNAQ